MFILENLILQTINSKKYRDKRPRHLSFFAEVVCDIFYDMSKEKTM